MPIIVVFRAESDQNVGKLTSFRVNIDVILAPFLTVLASFIEELGALTMVWPMDAHNGHNVGAIGCS